MKENERSTTQTITNIMEAPLLSFSRRNAEGRLLALMALGNPGFLAAQLDVCISARMDEFSAALSSTSLTQAKYQGIAFINLACRTALGAGADEASVEAIRDEFSRRYAKMTDPALQWGIAKDLLQRLSEAIRTQRLLHCCAAVCKCCEYIDQKFYSTISLDELGELCGLSPHYISDLFRTELGLGALQYVHQVKLLHAKFLLEHSTLGISAIASLMSYPSHSNFSQRFKKTYGVTPHEYRAIFSN